MKHNPKTLTLRVNTRNSSVISLEIDLDILEENYYLAKNIVDNSPKDEKILEIPWNKEQNYFKSLWATSSKKFEGG